MKKLSPYAKAVAGFVAGAVTAYLGATDGGVTGTEWLYILVAGLGGSGLVYITPNKPHAKGERGAADVVTILVVVLLVVLILFLLGFVR